VGLRGVGRHDVMGVEVHMTVRSVYTKDARGMVIFHSWHNPTVADLIEIAKTEFPHVRYSMVNLWLAGKRKDVEPRIAISDLNTEKHYQPDSVISLFHLEEHAKDGFPDSPIHDVFVWPHLRKINGRGLHEDTEKRFHLILSV